MGRSEMDDAVERSATAVCSRVTGPYSDGMPDNSVWVSS